MGIGTKRNAVIRTLVILCTVFCSIGTTASLYVVLVRVPEIATTKLDVLFGTLLGVTLGLLFAIAALLTHCMVMLSRLNRSPALALDGD